MSTTLEERRAAIDSMIADGNVGGAWQTAIDAGFLPRESTYLDFLHMFIWKDIERSL